MKSWEDHRMESVQECMLERAGYIKKPFLAPGELDVYEVDLCGVFWVVEYFVFWAVK